MSGVEYYLGLDMGTVAVGWAVTDKNYKILRSKGKDLWGIREFEEAQVASERRAYRTSRRRRQRELVRIGLLKEFFHDAIAEIDPAFYQRLENSKYHLEDKDINIRDKNTFFCDPEYKDKDYFRAYPTIFHLRKELIFNQEKHDVRLVYLALLNMFKHRGHFLNTSLSDTENGREFVDIYQEFCQLLCDETGLVFEADFRETVLKDIFANRDYSRTQKAEELVKALKINRKDRRKREFVKAICGLKVNAKLLFEDLNVEENNKIEICFSEYGYEDKIQGISEALGEKYYAIIALMKEIYDLGTLGSIMRGFTYLSEARVAEYDKHKEDLKVLKKIVKKYNPSKAYNHFFRSENSGTYSAYVNSVNTGNKFRRDIKERGIKDLYKSIRQLLKDMPKDDPDVIYVRQEIEKETFLPKQLTADNGIIPNQVHAREMKKILMNAEHYLPFLKKKDETGLSVTEKILKLFSFQIPYYVGPTSSDSKTGWVVRKEAGAVLPWNIQDKIDIRSTAEEFVTRLVRRCSYIRGERVLPRTSLMYESFCVLNEINNIAVDGKRIGVSLKQDIYNELFKTGKRVTRKQLVKYLISRGVLKDETQISGIDEKLKNSLATYGKFRSILGDKIENDDCREMVEDIVYWGTIYGGSKDFLKEKILERYKAQLSSEQVKKIMAFRLKDWGTVSKEFLEMPGCDKSTGEIKTLLSVMWETNLNLIELLNSSEYSYQEELENRQKAQLKMLTEIQPEDLDGYYFSAPMKRMVWQTLLIIKELELILGAPPKRVYLNLARKTEEKKRRTISRKQKLLNLYKNIREESVDWKTKIEKANADGRLRSKKMYLYFTQKGRCMYTGEKINVDDIFNHNLYDIDHIYPRHFVKDDDIDNNLVLVKKAANVHKSDAYPIEESVFINQKEMWKELLQLKLITEEKYNRLTGRKAFTDEQKAGFIRNQMVETGFGRKGIADILQRVLPDTEVSYVKAINVSEFRHKMEMPKCRSLNEFYHAQDAYLNIVVGNVYYVKFSSNPLESIKKEHYNLSRMFDWDVIRGNEVAWISEKGEENLGTIYTVKKMLERNTPLLSRRNFENHGGLANETLYSADKANAANYIPLKSSDEKLADVTKYGGFTSVSGAYFFLVEHGPENKRIRTIETLPVYMKEKVDKNEESLVSYCIDNLKLINPSIRLAKIKIQSLLKKDGYYMYVSGKTGNRLILRNAVNLCLQQKWIQYVKKLEKYMQFRVWDKEIAVERNIGLYVELMEKHTNAIYAKRPNSIGEKLVSKFDLFKKLEVEKQCEVLMQIIRLSAIGSDCADLSLLKEPSHCGKMLMPKKIGTDSKLLLIHQSVTGIFEKQTDLLTV